MRPRTLIRWLLRGGALQTNETPNLSAVSQALALVQADAIDGFRRFRDLGTELDRYADANRDAVRASISRL